MLLTCKAKPRHRICEEKIPKTPRIRRFDTQTPQSNEFINQREMFTGLFEGATSNRAELDYRIILDASSQGVSILYISFMHAIPRANIVGFIDTIYLILPAIYHLSNTTAHLQLTVVPS